MLRSIPTMPPTKAFTSTRSENWARLALMPRAGKAASSCRHSSSSHSSVEPQDLREEHSGGFGSRMVDCVRRFKASWILPIPSWSLSNASVSFLRSRMCSRHCRSATFNSAMTSANGTLVLHHATATFLTNLRSLTSALTQAAKPNL